ALPRTSNADADRGLIVDLYFVQNGQFIGVIIEQRGEQEQPAHMSLRPQFVLLYAGEGTGLAVAAGPAVAAGGRLDERGCLFGRFQLHAVFQSIGPLPNRLQGEGDLRAEIDGSLRLRPNRLEPGELVLAAVGLDGSLDDVLGVLGADEA